MKRGFAPRFPEIGHLHLRALQAPIAARLIREFATALGREKALAIATAAIGADAFAAGKSAAERCGANSLVEMAGLVRNLWAKDGAMAVEFLEESPRALRFRVTRCGYVDLYQELGVRDLGFCLSCSRDEPFARGFNPAIRFTRGRTIMEGAASCDFLYELEEAPPA